MGVDAALNRVGNEQNNQKLAIGEELLLATQEMQAGARRKDVLIRLAETLWGGRNSWIGYVFDSNRRTRR